MRGKLKRRNKNNDRKSKNIIKALCVMTRFSLNLNAAFLKSKQFVQKLEACVSYYL